MTDLRKIPGVSVITCTYNGESVLEDYFRHLLMQDYSLKNIEIIIGDGGSTDNSIEIIAKYRKEYPETITFFHNKKKYSEGRGMGKDTASKLAHGELLLFLDQDNILIQKNWLRGMVSILQKDHSLVGVQSSLEIPENSTIIDRYLGAVGIEDPFAIPYSLNAQIILHPDNFEYNQHGNYYVYTMNRRNFLYAGNNGFLIRRKEFLKHGGYVQDTENFYRMAQHEVKIAVAKKLKLYHRSSTSLIRFITKRDSYVRHYMRNNYQHRNFYWFDLKRAEPKDNLKFIVTVLFNILFVPGLIVGVKMAIKKRKLSWLIHPIMLFCVTVSYIWSYFGRVIK